MLCIIYQIINSVNGKSYIGKTTKTLEERFTKHIFNSKYGGNTYLYKAMRKYGIENFQTKILEETTLEQLNEKECYWISKLIPEYNMTAGGDGGDTSNSPNYRKGIEEYHKTKDPMSYATYGMLGKKQSKKFEEAIQRVNNCPVICEGVEYPSVGAAEKAYPGISLRKRLDNPKYPEFYRLRERTRRK